MSSPFACQVRGLFFAFASLSPMLIFLLNSQSKSSSLERKFAIVPLKYDVPTQLPEPVLGLFRLRFGGDWPWLCSPRLKGLTLNYKVAACGSACKLPPSVRKTFLFWGDSHVMALLEGIHFLGQKYGNRSCFLAIGRPNGFPAANYMLRSKTEALGFVSNKARHFSKSILDFLPRLNANLTHIFIGGRWDWYIRKFTTVPIRGDKSSRNISESENLVNFKRSFRDTFSNLKLLGFNSTFLGMVPEFKPEAIFRFCNYTGRTPKNYSEPISSSPSRKIFRSITVPFIDPTLLFCKLSTASCAPAFGNRCSYWDDTHLGPNGALAYASLIDKYIQNEIKL